MPASLFSVPGSKVVVPGKILLTAACGVFLVWTPSVLPVLFGAAAATPFTGNEVSESNFPYAIRVTFSPADEGFRPGDGIVITSVRGDRPYLEPGGTYLVQGSYVLQSASAATLALSLTSSANGGRSQWAESQHARIVSGPGTFAFIATMRAEGRYHVSFYFPDPDRPGTSSSGGGVYFDER